ncbi:MAG: TerC family protein, partial [Bacteroidota bacterium]
EMAINPEKNPILKWARKIIRVTPQFEGDKFFIRKEGLLWATPLFLVVIMIEATDLIFAVDSIPAILAVSDDAFIVYTSNVFAILGLRSLYFALAGIEKFFVYLKYGLSAILIFVGLKMCISDWYKVPIEISLAFIVLTLSMAVLASMVMQKKEVA